MLPKTGYNLQFSCSSLYISPTEPTGLGRQLSWEHVCLTSQGSKNSPRTHVQKQDIVAHACNPNARKVETGTSLGLPAQLAYLPYSMNFRPVRDPVSVARWMGPEEQKSKVVAWPPQAHMSMHTPECTQTCIHTGRDSLLILKSALNFQPLGCHVDLSSQPHRRLLFLAATTKYSLGAYCKFCVPNGTHYLYIQLGVHSCSSDSINSSTVAHMHMFGRDACTLPTLWPHHLFND